MGSIKNIIVPILSKAFVIVIPLVQSPSSYADATPNILSTDYVTCEQALSTFRVNSASVQMNDYQKALVTVLNAINAKHQNLKPTFVKTEPSVRFLTHKFLNSEVSGSKFTQLIRDEFGSWDSGLEAAGLLTVHISRKGPFWTKERLKEVLIFLHEQGIPPTRHRIRTNHEKVKSLTQKKFNRVITLSALDKMIAKFITDWKEAPQLIEKKVSPADFGNDYWSKDLVIKCLQKVHQAGFQINAESIRENSPDLNSFLQDITQSSKTTGGALYEAARRNFKQYSEALKAAGFDPFKVEINSRYWSTDLIISAIWKLEENELLTNSDALKESSQEINLLLSNLVGKKGVTGAALVSAMQRVFGSFNKALNAAGISYMDITKGVRYWSAELVVKTLQKIKSAELPMNRKSVYLPSPSMLKIIRSSTGFKNASKYSLRYALERYFKKPTDAYIAADLDPKLFKAPSVELDKPLLINIIKSLFSNDVPMNYSAMLTIGYSIPWITNIILKTAGKAFSTRTIILSSIREFSSWRHALIAADIDPEDIYIKGLTPLTDLPDHLATKRKRERGRFITDHITVGTVYVNDQVEINFIDNRLPEDSVALNEMLEGMSNFSETLNQREYNIYITLIETVDLIHSYDELIPSVLNSDIIEDLKESEVLSLISKMKEGLISFNFEEQI